LVDSCRWCTELTPGDRCIAYSHPVAMSHPRQSNVRLWNGTYSNLLISEELSHPHMKDSSCLVSSLGWSIGQQGRPLGHTSPAPGGRSTCGNHPTRSDPRQFAGHQWKCNAEHQPVIGLLKIPTNQNLSICRACIHLGCRQTL